MKSMVWQAAAMFILLAFYTVYIGKMLAQKKKGIQTDHMARGKQKNKAFYIELFMKAATYGAVAAELASILFDTSVFPAAVRAAGLVLGVCGVVIFSLSVWTMRDNWRAGIAPADKTEMVTAGVYQFSRNPAFLGFYLLYGGLLLAFFNGILLAVTLLAGIMLHLQVLQEEAYLPTVFGEPYIAYKNRVKRYWERH